MTRRELVPALSTMCMAVFTGSPMIFRDIERLENGRWERADFSNLHTGDTFRFMDDIQTRLKCLGNAYPIRDVAGNYGVECEKLIKEGVI